MSSLIIAGDTSGQITIAAPAVAGSNTLTLPVITDTITTLNSTQTLANKTLTAPVFSGTATGTYTLGGTPTISSPTISAPTLSGTTTGTYTLGGTPSLAATALTGTIAAARLPAGSALQVVGAIKTDTFSTNSTSYQTVTGLAATITPSSSSSKILVLMAISGGAASGGTWHGKVQRNGTDIALGDAAGSRRRDSFGSLDNNGGDFTIGSAFIFLDSPATTSAVTYQVLLCAGDGAGTMYINRPDFDSDNSNGTRTSSTVVLMEIAA